jgi:hypothetical protein
VTPSLSLAQSGSGQGGNCSVPKKEREIRGVDFGVVNWVFHVQTTYAILRSKGVPVGKKDYIEAFYKV